jgi:hypothetical protein
LESAAEMTFGWIGHAERVGDGRIVDGNGVNVEVGGVEVNGRAVIVGKVDGVFCLG